MASDTTPLAGAEGLYTEHKQETKAAFDAYLSLMDELAACDSGPKAAAVAVRLAAVTITLAAKLKALAMTATLVTTVRETSKMQAASRPSTEYTDHE